MTLRRKVQKTFAQPSPYENIFQAISPGRGGQIEILISWHERVLQTCHYPVGPSVTVGNRANINLPFGTMSRNFKLIESLYGQAVINLPIESKNYIQKSDDRERLQVEAYQLNQNEVVFMTFSNNISLAIRFAPIVKHLSVSQNFFLTLSEMTALFFALIISFFANLFFSVKSLKMKKAEEPVQRIIEVVFKRPQKPVEYVVTKSPAPEIKIQPELKPIIVNNPPLENKPLQRKRKNEPKPLIASEVGLMSALSAPAMKNKIDQINRGSNEILVNGESATGISSSDGISFNQKWDQYLKSVGEGGASTASVGISQSKPNRGRYGDKLKTRPWGGEQKDQVRIQAGTGEENFIGTIDRDAVRRAVRSHLQAVKHCYEKEYKKNSQLNGKVVIAWEINQDGFAQNARVMGQQTTIDNRIVEECVRSVIETIRFPQPPQDALVEITGFPFVFSGLK